MKLRWRKVGCAAPLGMLFLALVVVGVGLFWADILRPHHPLEAPLRRVIANASLSHYHSDITGWDEANVTDEVCPMVDADSLNELGLASYFQSRRHDPEREADHLDDADIWYLTLERNLIAQCIDRAVRSLSIEIQRGTGQCRAFVSPIPVCDP